MVGDQNCAQFVRMFRAWKKIISASFVRNHLTGLFNNSAKGAVGLDRNSRIIVRIAKKKFRLTFIPVYYADFRLLWNYSDFDVKTSKKKEDRK